MVQLADSKIPFFAGSIQEVYLKYFFPEVWYAIDHWIFYKKKDKILDLGCGPGVFSVSLAKAGCEVSSCDPSIAAVQSTQLLFQKQKLTGKFEVCMPENLPFSSNYFDAVVSINLLEISSSPEHSIAEISRVLKPGGKALVVSFAVPSPWGFKFVLDALRYRERPSNFQPMTTNRIKQILKMSNLKVDAIKRKTRFLPFTLLGYKIPWFASSWIAMLEKDKSSFHGTGEETKARE